MLSSQISLSIWAVIQHSVKFSVIVCLVSSKRQVSVSCWQLFQLLVEWFVNGHSLWNCLEIFSTKLFFLLILVKECLYGRRIFHSGHETGGNRSSEPGEHLRCFRSKGTPIMFLFVCKGYYKGYYNIGIFVTLRDWIIAILKPQISSIYRFAWNYFTFFTVLHMLNID